MFGLQQRLRLLRKHRDYDIGKHPCPTCGAELRPEENCKKCDRPQPVAFIGANDLPPVV